MPRENKTAAEIRAEVQRLIDSNDRVGSDKAQIRVPEPTPMAQVDKTGCNWSMEYFGNARGYEDVVGRALAEVQARWNLA